MSAVVQKLGVTMHLMSGRQRFDHDEERKPVQQS
jgi:hypothetical protein